MRFTTIDYDLDPFFFLSSFGIIETWCTKELCGYSTIPGLPIRSSLKQKWTILENIIEFSSEK